ncbi:MAG: urease accessory protein UreD [Candidatus Acidiferrales bacterium]
MTILTTTQGSGSEALLNFPRPGRLQASLQLEFQQDSLTGQTCLASTRQEPPLQVVRAFPIEDGSAMAHLHNISGGILGGDSLALEVRVGPGAKAQLTTTGATRIYRPRAGTEPATQRNTITIEENALLEFVPDGLIPFAGSRYFQQTSIHLSPGAGMFWWEVITPGREARGEIFQYESLEMKFEMFARGRPIAAEHFRLEPHASDLTSSARFGIYRYYATFYVCRLGLPPGIWLGTEQTIRETLPQLSQSGKSLCGVSTLISDGVVIRILACHGRDVLAGLHSIWQTAKVLLYGRNAVPPRKVY